MSAANPTFTRRFQVWGEKSMGRRRGAGAFGGSRLAAIRSISRANVSAGSGLPPLASEAPFEGRFSSPLEAARSTAGEAEVFAVGSPAGVSSGSVRGAIPWFTGKEAGAPGGGGAWLARAASAITDGVAGEAGVGSPDTSRIGAVV